VVHAEANRDDPPRLSRQKLARITLESMVEHVGLLDAQGTVPEVNKVAFDAVGIKLSDVEEKWFWTIFWWPIGSRVTMSLLWCGRTLLYRAGSESRGEWL
jgi:hypothetical protein